MSYTNDKKTVKTLYDAGWKISYFISADFSMLIYGCGVSQYPQFLGKDLDIYQVLPRPYLWSFECGPGDKLIIKKWVLDLASREETFFWECIESRIASDDSEKLKVSQYWTTLKKKTREGKKNYHQHAKLGKLYLSLWVSLVVDFTVITPKILTM